MPHSRIVVIGASAGGFEAVRAVLETLPSGALSDGTIGLHAIKHAGGFAVVQHPEEAPFPSMPLSALRTVAVDAVLPVSAIGPQLVEWAMNGAGPRPEGAQREGRTTRGKGGQPEPAPQLLAVTCPSCGGAIRSPTPARRAETAARPASAAGAPRGIPWP